MKGVAVVMWVTHGVVLGSMVGVILGVTPLGFAPGVALGVALMYTGCYTGCVSGGVFCCVCYRCEAYTAADVSARDTRPTSFIIPKSRCCDKYHDQGVARDLCMSM